MTAPVLAAGAVCWRVTDDGEVEILVVFRTQHRDWSLPKGKLDPGETLPETAVREIEEETGLRISLGVPLGVVDYVLPNGREKFVSYWAAEVSSHAISKSTFVTNDEIESLHWMTPDAARARFSYPHDVDIVERFSDLYQTGRARTFAIIAVRHGKAVDGSVWDGPDATRPLMQRGSEQARSLAPGIAAFQPAKLFSSTAVRCLSTIDPTSRLTGLEVRAKKVLSQDAYSPDGAAIGRFVEKRLARARTAVLCSHGPVLPQIMASLAEATGSSELLRGAGQLAPGEYAVVHLPAADPTSGLVALEIHGPAIEDFSLR
ncbi:MAG TPA: NUDIX hydrolase [Pseudolysinimonas sp.]|nr:NUDIX hydrolase [Pseudolysinimonas sp.]